MSEFDSETQATREAVKAIDNLVKAFSFTGFQIATASTIHREAQLREFVAKAKGYGATIDYDKLVSRVKKLHDSTMLSYDEAIEETTRRLMRAVREGRFEDALAILDEDNE